MTTLREAAQQALEALERIDQADNDCDFLNPSQCYQLDAAMTALRAALAEQKHKPNCALLQIPSRDCDCQEPVQEPIATVASVATVVSESGNQEVTMSWWHEPALPVGTKLYTSPPQRKENNDE